MKKSLLFLLALATPVSADTFQIGVQYTLNPGFNIQWSVPGGGGGCGAPNQGGNNCAVIPPGKGVSTCTGTQTIKVDGVELLARIVCGTPSNFETIWQGHHLSSGSKTIMLLTPGLSPNDPQLRGNGVNACWVEYQAGAASQSPVGGGWEMQVTCSAQ